METVFLSKKYNPNNHFYHSCYRGQPNANWEIESSLFRVIKNLNISEEKSRKIENSIKRDFIANAHLYDPYLNSKLPKDNLTLLSIMQHHSCPTRLVDWSLSPYIGLYFAVSDYFTEEGCLFLLNNNEYEQSLKLKYNNLNNVHPSELQCIFMNTQNLRLNLQQGAFTNSEIIMKPHCQLIKELGKEVNRPSALYRYIIPKNLKVEFLSNLKLMNIDSKTLFPDLDGFGRSLKERLLIRNWIENTNIQH